MPADRILNVLFLCTGNSARSIMGEAIMNSLGKGKFKAYSAGSHPKSEPNPNAISLLKSFQHDTSKMRSKSWHEFEKPGAPEFDFIFTVCDDAAGETCPVWPGNPMTAHWGIADPAAVEGSELEVAKAFREAYQLLRRRIEIFVALPFAKLDEMSLQHKLKEIGRIEGATKLAESV